MTPGSFFFYDAYMKLSDFDYNLPKNLIAQKPISPRDHSRLLIFNRETKKIAHRRFYDIGNYLRPGDIWVLNNSKVFPARLIGRKVGTGGKIEIFLLRPPSINPPAFPPPPWEGGGKNRFFFSEGGVNNPSGFATSPW